MLFHIFDIRATKIDHSVKISTVKLQQFLEMQPGDRRTDSGALELCLFLPLGYISPKYLNQ